MERHRIIRGALQIVLILSSAIPASSLGAQESPSGHLRIEDVAKVLKVALRPDPGEMAWRAYAVREYRLTDEIPQLVEMLASNSDLYGTEAHLARIGILDSIIQLNADMPAELAVDLFKQYPAEIMAYAARAPKKRENLLLFLLEHTPNLHHRFAISMLLADIKSTGLASVLLKDLRIDLQISVVDTVGCGGGFGMSMCGGVGADPHIPSAFPPTARYTLAIKKPAPPAYNYHQVSFERSMIQPGELFPDRSLKSEVDVFKDKWRLESLARLLGILPENIGIDLDVFHSIHWKGAAHYKREALAIRQRILDSYRGTVELFVETGLLSKFQSSKLQPKIAVRVVDCRTETSVALPAIPGQRKRQQ